MPATTVRPRGRQRRRHDVRSRPSASQRGGRVLFEIRFASAMTTADLGLLHRQLDMTTHVEQKMRPDPNSPGVVRLDHHSGLFLKRRDGKDQWLLQARTWGNPAAQTIHEWHLFAAQAACRLDPKVALPRRLPETEPEMRPRQVERTSNGRLAGLRRRLAGLA